MGIDIHINTEGQLFLIRQEGKRYQIEEFESLGRSLNFVDSWPYHGSLTECILYVCETFIWGRGLVIDEIWNGQTREYST